MTDPLALVLTHNIGPKRLETALATDRSPEAVDQALGKELGTAYRKTLAEQKAEREREQAEKLGVRIVGVWDRDYPEALRHLASPPSALWLKGEFPPASPGVGVVGTRKASAWALAWTAKVARELAEAGVSVVSGLARGIDTESHKGAVEGGGYTLGVLGGAVDKLYPAENRALAERMSVVSEFPLGTAPKAELFPRRNRIIAALSKAVLVVEAGEKSGSLITAKFALEVGRDVLAVPGRPGDPLSLGCNRLIRDGAGLVLSTEDVLNALGLFAPARPQVALEGDEAKLHRTLLELSEALPDDLAQAAGLPTGETLSLLTMLELKGLVRAVPGGRYALA